jgi:protein lifeguard
LFSHAVPPDPFVQTVYAALGAFLFSAYLVYDIQLVMGGKRVEISTDEYIIAALMIYLDIINLFLCVFAGVWLGC